ncbi:hypothetical protein [Chitinolyticbacter meiyuanensis]|uniref:hypothetical protein n=1 Tax=Chitinolyticbacter meiyuanensis TaxID=682798 RepID=UPI0011E5FCBB|nr:hypothetical protein [Chitinolyticbacter meiyuanensis]
MNQGQRIAGDVGLVAHGSVTIHGGLKMERAANQDQAGGLIGAQRERLHQLVTEIQELKGSVCEQEARRAWKLVHRATGRSLQQLTTALFPQAEAALLQEIDSLKGDKKRGRLLRLILTRTSEDGGLRQRVNDFALRQCGSSFLKDLTFEQLQGVLAHLDTLTGTTTVEAECPECAENRAQMMKLMREGQALKTAARNIQDKRDRAHAEELAKVRGELDTYRAATRSVQGKQDSERQATITWLREERDQLKKLVETARGRETQQDVDHAVALHKLRGRWMAVAAMAAFGGVLFGAWVL